MQDPDLRQLRERREWLDTTSAAVGAVSLRTKVSAAQPSKIYDMCQAQRLGCPCRLCGRQQYVCMLAALVPDHLARWCMCAKYT